MKIIEICLYSAGGCGVWARVKQESIELIKRGHEVRVFSSYFEKGSNKIMREHENIGKIQIQRFPAIKLGGESFMYWDYEKEALRFQPDIMIVHNYRHLHTTKALSIREKLKKQGKKCKVFLVTHAPFARSETRSLISKIIVWYYDKFIAPRYINKFDKILAVSKWEIPYLLELSVKKEKIIYIPNGIPKEFFTQKKSKEDKNKILFLGRIAPIKNLEVLIKSMSYIKNKKIKIEIVGPAEENYFKKLKNLIEKLNLKGKIIFSKPIYDIREKIKKIDSCKIFVLPSKSEGMPQSLIEAMSRGKIVIGNNTLAIRDLIKDKKNGYLFEFNNPEDLALKINLALENNKKNKDIKSNAKKFVEKFRWSKIIKQIESLF